MSVTLLVLVMCFHCSFMQIEADISKTNDPSLQHLDRDRYVDQKFERLERLLLQKDDIISELKTQLASHVNVYTNYVTNNAVEMELMKSAQTQLQQDVSQKDQLLQELRKQMVELDNIVSKREKAKELLPHSTDDDVIPNVNTGVEPLTASFHDTKLVDAIRVSGEVMNGGLKPNSTTNIDNASGGVEIMSVVKNGDLVTKSILYEGIRPEDEEGAGKRGTGRIRLASNPVTNVAFHAEMTVTGTVVKNSPLVYNHEVLDHGEGYSPSDGIYLVPESGTYVITWTTVTYHDYVQTLLIVNGVRRGSSMTDAQEVTDVHQTTMIVVLTLKQGDHVSIHVGSLGHGTIHVSDVYSKPTFSGWKLCGTQ